MPRRSPAFILVHAVWATHRRRRTLPRSFDETLGEILGDKLRRVGCVLLAAGCGHDHVHVLFRLAPTIALSNVLQRVKGATAHDVNQRRLLLDRLVWQEGYWAESLGPAGFDSLARYIRSQREHHDDSHPAERWNVEPALLGGL